MERPFVDVAMAMSADGAITCAARESAAFTSGHDARTMDRVREHELQQAMRKLGDLSPEQRAMLEHFSRALMNKFLHEPSVRLRTAAANGRGLAIVDAARYLFGLEGQGAPDGGAAPPPEGPTTPTDRAPAAHHSPEDTP